MEYRFLKAVHSINLMPTDVIILLLANDFFIQKKKGMEISRYEYNNILMNWCELDL